MKALVIVLSVLVAGALAAAPAPDSLYQLDLALMDQQGRAFRLNDVAGKPVMIAMFYASCPNTCPILVSSIKMMEQKLEPEARKGLRVLLVSFDPERDTPEKLAELARSHKVDLSRWTFARPATSDVRLLSAALDVRYRKLPDGEFNHSAVITLLDGEGRPVARTSKLGEADPEFLAALRSLLH